MLQSCVVSNIRPLHVFFIIKGMFMHNYVLTFEWGNCTKEQTDTKSKLTAVEHRNFIFVPYLHKEKVKMPWKCHSHEVQLS